MSDKTVAALAAFDKRLATIEAIVKNALPKETVKVLEKELDEQKKLGETNSTKQKELEKALAADQTKDKEDKAKRDAKHLKLETELQQQKAKAIGAETLQKSKDLQVETRLKVLETLVQQALNLANTALAKR